MLLFIANLLHIIMIIYMYKKRKINMRIRIDTFFTHININFLIFINHTINVKKHITFFVETYELLLFHKSYYLNIIFILFLF